MCVCDCDSDVDVCVCHTEGVTLMLNGVTVAFHVTFLSELKHNTGDEV